MWQTDAMGMRERIKATIEAKPGLTVRSVSLAAGLSDSLLSKFLKGQNDSSA
jgi:lambda repressor-like predicted transcriptional regulator